MDGSNANAIALISEGCKMARILEENLPNWANHLGLLFDSCTQISRFFGEAKENLLNKAPIILRDPQPQLLGPVSPPSSGRLPPAMGLHNPQLLLGFPGDARMKGPVLTPGQEAGGGGTLAEVVAPIGPRGSSGEVLPPPEVGPAASGGLGGAPPSSSQRPRRRSDGGDRRVERVAAPQMGNTEIPPEDGYAWRKYGQKRILHSRFPRSYFRCTHQKLYNCPAKRQVQRLEDDPNTFEVTYRGGHTCHFSSTAPSAPPPSSAPLPRQIISTAAAAAAIIHPTADYQHHPSQQPSFSLSQWLSMDLVGSSSARPAGGASPSSSRTPQVDQQYLQHQPNVADMADAMFNSGSSSNNSMGLIFPSMDDRRDSGEREINASLSN